MLVPCFPVLETPRLRLREITEDDGEWYLRHFSDPAIVHGSGYPAPPDLEGARHEVRTYIVDLFATRSGIRWGLTLREDRAPAALIGSAGFYRWVDEPRAQAELGYDLAPVSWGRGLMAEALRAILDFGFSTMGLARVEATVLTDNERSRRTLERLGFVRVALVPECGPDEHGVLRDEYLYALERRPVNRRD